MDFFGLLQGHAAVFLLLLTRVSGLFIVSPFFGSMNVPVYFRAGISFAFTLVLFPVIDAMGAVQPPSSMLMYAGSVLSELFIGWLIGLVAYISFAAINMAGKIMDMQVGFAIVNVMDPTSGQQIPLIGSFLYNLALIIFLVTNGHHVIITALVGSFTAVPILAMAPNLSLAAIITNFTVGIFLTGMKIALPVTFAILLTNTGLGILARTMPQLNIFVVGLPLQIVIGLTMLMMLMPFYVLFLDVLFNGMYGNINIVLRALQ